MKKSQKSKLSFLKCHFNTRLKMTKFLILQQLISKYLPHKFMLIDYFMIVLSTFFFAIDLQISSYLHLVKGQEIV